RCFGRVEMIRPLMSHPFAILGAEARQAAKRGLHLRSVVEGLGGSGDGVHLEQHRGSASAVGFDMQVMLSVLQPLQPRSPAAKLDMRRRIVDVVDCKQFVLSVRYTADACDGKNGK